MQTKFVYIFVVLVLGMSSFAVANTHAKRYGSKQNHYRTSTPKIGLASEVKTLCESARLEMAGVPRRDSECQGKGESGSPHQVIHDSECTCNPVEGVPPAQESSQTSCTFGVSWVCDFQGATK